MSDLKNIKILTHSAIRLEGEKIIYSEIEEGMRKEAQFYRDKLLDQLSMFSDELTELLLAEEEIPEEMIRAVMREAVLSDMGVPVLCGSALDGIGVQPVMDAVGYYLPSPLDIPPVEGIDPNRPDDPKTIRRPSPDESGRPPRAGGGSLGGGYLRGDRAPFQRHRRYPLRC